MRITIRFNEVEKRDLEAIKLFCNEDDNSKAIKFAIEWALHHIKYVTMALIGPDWEVIFQKKRKGLALKRKVYMD